MPGLAEVTLARHTSNPAVLLLQLYQELCRWLPELTSCNTTTQLSENFEHKIRCQFLLM